MRILLDNRACVAEPGQSLLEALLAAGIPLPNGCRSGVCQSCIVQLIDGEMPPGAQAGLRAAQRETGQLLACQARPRGDLVLGRCSTGQAHLVEVLESTEVGDGIFRLRTTRPDGMTYRSGQYVTLWRDDELCRAYSLASIPEEAFLEFHVRRYPGGRLSQWLWTRVAGERITLRGPMGHCVYEGTEKVAPLLLVGIGVGLAPLWGIVRTAFAANHSAPIHLLHAVSMPGRAYLDVDLRAFAAARASFHYQCLVGGVTELLAELFAISRSFAGWRVFLCGSPEAVTALRRHVFLAGAASADILADAFVPQAPEKY